MPKNTAMTTQELLDIAEPPMERHVEFDEYIAPPPTATPPHMTRRSIEADAKARIDYVDSEEVVAPQSPPPKARTRIKDRVDPVQESIPSKPDVGVVDVVVIPEPQEPMTVEDLVATATASTVSPRHPQTLVDRSFLEKLKQLNQMPREKIDQRLDEIDAMFTLRRSSQGATKRDATVMLALALWESMDL